MFRIILFLFSIFISGIVSADTYPASGIWYYGGQSFSTLDAACTFAFPGGAYIYQSSTMPSTCNVLYYGSPTTAIISRNPTCPYGGVASADQCINAPACTTPKVRNSTTGACEYPPVDCKPPETDNGFGLCSVKECTGGQVLNGSSGDCQTPPVCGSTETYENSTNSCKLYPLNCPGHAHANSTNDGCLKDPPLGCPPGQHDDGTYNCVANDGPAPCTSDQQKGYIMGIPQCVNKPNLDTIQQEAATKAAAAKNSAAAAVNAANTAQLSAAAAAADPTDSTKAAAAASDAAAANTAASVSSSNKSLADEADNAAKNAYLKSIADTTKAIDDRQLDDLKDSGASAPTAEPIPVVEHGVSVSVPSVNIMACPASSSVTTSHGSLSMSYQPYCDFALGIRPMILGLAYLFGGMIFIGGIKS